MLDEMDEVFGVSALVAEEEEADKRARYTANHLKGLRVAHDLDAVCIINILLYYFTIFCLWLGP